MRVAVHDYAGHPFQVELSRELAYRGHDVLHLYSASITTPRGRLTKLPDDPSGFAIDAITVEERIPRERLVARRRLEARHGTVVVERLARFAPDVVLSANAPLEAQRRIYDYCRRERIRFVYWLQDLIGEAAKRLLPTKLHAVGRPIAWYYENLERRLLWSADAVVVISEDFLPYVPSTAEVIENWAPIERLPVVPKENDWSKRHGLESTTNLLYSGTLGMKQDPGLLLGIARSLADKKDVRVAVASEGAAADWLRQQAGDQDLSNLVVLPFQPFEDLAAMLGSADVLVGILEREAGVFSVPSKVLTYLCAGRPLVLAVPGQNLAAKTVGRIGAGIVVEPDDRHAVFEAVRRLVDSPDERAAMGTRARAYAERTFELGPIAERFESVLSARPTRRLANATPSAGNGDGGRSTSNLVSVIVVSYDCRDALEHCLASLAVERENADLEVIVIDNASHDGTAEMVKAEHPWVRLFENRENVGFARSANRAMEVASGDYLLLLNPDTVVPPGTFAAVLQQLRERPDVGMVGCKLVRPDGTFDHACKRGFPTIASAFYYFVGLNGLFPHSSRFAQYTAGHLDDDETALVDAVNGAFMFVRREAVEDVGGMDERYWLYAEDLDWCRRFWARGWKILYWPGVEVTHIKGASAGDHRSWKLNREFHHSIWLYYEKHHAPQRSPLVSGGVWLGLWSKFVVSALRNATRPRGRGHTQRREPLAPTNGRVS